MACYKSWIPNLTGRMSFKNFGNDLKGSKGKYYIAKDEPGISQGDMYINFFGEIYTSDSIIKNKYTDFLSENSGLLFYEVLGSVKSVSADVNSIVEFPDEPRGDFFGIIALSSATHSIPRNLGWGRINEYNRLEKAENFHEIFSNIVSDTISLRTDQIDNNYNEKICINNSAVKELFRKHENYLYNQKDRIISRFAIKKDGNITINSIDMITTYNYGSYDEEYKTTENLGDNAKEAIAITVFNILREKFHKHKHHSQSNDSIVGVYSQDNGSTTNWQLRVIASLREKIRALHDIDYESTQSKALGVCSYFNAFCQNNFCKDQNIPDNVIFVDTDHTSKSLLAKKMHLEEINRTKFHKDIFILTGLGALIALIGILTNTFNDHDNIKAVTIPIGAYILCSLLMKRIHRVDENSAIETLLRLGNIGLYWGRAIFTALSISSISVQPETN